MICAINKALRHEISNYARSGTSVVFPLLSRHPRWQRAGMSSPPVRTGSSPVCSIQSEMTSLDITRYMPIVLVAIRQVRPLGIDETAGNRQGAAVNRLRSGDVENWCWLENLGCINGRVGSCPPQYGEQQRGEHARGER